MKNGKLLGYLKMDIYRVTHTLLFYAAPVLISLVIGVMSCVLAGSYENMKQNCILSLIRRTYCDSTVFLSTILAVSIYGNVLLEDREHKGEIQYRVRGNTYSYLLSKVIVAGVSAGAVMTIGGLLFVLYCRLTGHLWVATDTVESFVQWENTFYGLVQKGHYAGYCVVLIVQYSLLPVMMVQFGLFCSLFISSKAMTLILPLFTVYFIESIQGLINPTMANVETFFNAALSTYGGGMGHFFLVLTVTILWSVMIYGLLILKYHKG